MKLTTATLVGLCLVVAVAMAEPSKRFLINIHDIQEGLSHMDLACKLYPVLTVGGQGLCNARCIPMLIETVYGEFACPAICYIIFHEADKLAHCSS